MRSPAVLTLHNQTSPWGVPASVIFHTLLIAALAVMPAPKRPKRPQEDSVSVEILTSRQFDAATASPPAQPVSQAPAAASPSSAAFVAKPQSPIATGMIRPTQMLSAKTLADPRSRQARADLKTFAADERMVQLCNLEVMDQIRQWRADFQPERVVPYATAEEKVTGTAITADGAAFRSRKNWYSLKFKCQLAQDGESVIGFEFLVGDPVAREKWDELGLPAVH